MKRRKARENAFITLFELSFGGELEDVLQHTRDENEEYAVDGFGEELLKQYFANAEQVDTAIESKLKGWKVQRVARVNLAILRLAVTEMLFGEPDMDSVVINEAVELTKKYADETDYQFVNGVLGNLSRSKQATEE